MFEIKLKILINFMEVIHVSGLNNHIQWQEFYVWDKIKNPN